MTDERSHEQEPGEEPAPPPGPRDPQQERRPAAGDGRRRAPFTLLYLALAFLLLVALSNYVTADLRAAYPVSYDTFERLLEAGDVKSVVVESDQVVGELERKQEVAVLDDDQPRRAIERFKVTRLPGDAEYLLGLLKDADVQKEGRAEGGFGQYILLWVVMSLVFIVGLFFLLRLFSPSRQVMSFGKSRAKLYAEKETKVTFDQVAGIEEAKDELREVVDFLRDPRPYQRLGARIPRGILLVGPPGTGKTLLARAVAGEASVVFFSLSGSDFVEMFAGVGASRVRDLFEQAQKNAPCIVFIDELDALGKVRGVGLSGAHDEREQTLNQLLSEMDGFDPDKGVVILGATNRPEILDPALLRPGRFDRQVVVDRPDVRGRRQILKIHARKIRMGQVDLEAIAKQTPGLVGADLANVVNEAALLAGRKGQEEVGQAEFEEAIQRQFVGLERKSRVMAPHEKERIAVHETGHSLVALSVPRADPVARVSIIARGGGALGYTMQTPAEDRSLLTRGELEDRLAVLLGGRGAELLIYGDTSTGASDDLARATELARRMILEFGMSERIGPLNWGSQRQRYLANPMEPPSRPDYSEETAREVDEEVGKIVRGAEERVTGLLGDRREALEAIARALVKKEVILAEELRQLARDHGAAPTDTPRPALRLSNGDDEVPAPRAPEERAELGGGEAGPSEGGGPEQ